MIQVRIDPTAVLSGLSMAEREQTPYAISLALNRVANDAQSAMREELQSKFNLRRASWNLQGIKIEKADRATKTSWRVLISVDPGRSYLDKFEEGGEKLPIGGHRFLALPNPKVFKGIIRHDDPLRPKNLHLKKDAQGLFKGDQHTFILPRPNGEQMIAQRVAKDAKGKARRGRNRSTGVRILYFLKSKVTVKAQLHFVETITKSAESQWQPRWAEAFDQAMASRR